MYTVTTATKLKIAMLVAEGLISKIINKKNFGQVIIISEFYPGLLIYLILSTNDGILVIVCHFVFYQVNSS